jgi:hypothetical protein
VSISIDLNHLRGALKLICPSVDWSWLLTITKRIAAAAPRTTRKYHLVTSEASPQTDEACCGCGSDRRFMTSFGRTKLR